MKKSFVFFIFLFLSLISSKLQAQIKENNKVVNNSSNISPLFPGGDNALKNYLDTAIHYSSKARELQLEGNVLVKVIIDTDGSIKLPKIMKGLHPLLDAEALRVIKSMPRWIPGKQNGSKVPMSKTIEIGFKSINTSNESITAQKSVNLYEEPVPVEEETSKENILFFAEVMPTYKGKESVKAIKEFAEKNMKYPEKAIQDKIEGKVYLQFTVDKKGKVKDIVVIRGVDSLLNQEAIRLIQSMKKWEPGKQNNETVEVRITGLINFKLDNYTK